MIYPQTLLILPDQPIADIDGLLIMRLKKGRGSDYQAFLRTAALVNRYASGAVLERVQRESFASLPPRPLRRRETRLLLCYWLKHVSRIGDGHA